MKRIAIPAILAVLVIGVAIYLLSGRSYPATPLRDAMSADALFYATSERSAESIAAEAETAASKMLLDPEVQAFAQAFADNPLVTHAPRIRFYAGFPIFIGANCVGTVCVMDDKPRKIDTEAIGLLRDLATLAEMELCRRQRTNE